MKGMKVLPEHRHETETVPLFPQPWGYILARYADILIQDPVDTELHQKAVPKASS